MDFDIIDYKLFDYLNNKSDIFSSALFAAIFCASYEDKNRLRKVYPQHVEAVEKYTSNPEYFKNLCETVKNL